MIKETLVAAILIYSSAFPFFFYPGSEEGIRINITNLRNNKGHVLVSLFKDGKGYPDEPGNAYKKLKLDIKNGTAVASFSDLPPGTYAVAILHDENDDLKMNKNFFGLPKEGYGFSNNVMGMFGPPSYSKASFTHTSQKNTLITIRTRY
jgi:uncharacterized protein (DUF2141 family)